MESGADCTSRRAISTVRPVAKCGKIFWAADCAGAGAPRGAARPHTARCHSRSARSDCSRYHCADRLMACSCVSVLRAATALTTPPDDGVLQRSARRRARSAPAWMERPPRHAPRATIVRFQRQCRPPPPHKCQRRAAPRQAEDCCAKVSSPVGADIRPARILLSAAKRPPIVPCSATVRPYSVSLRTWRRSSWRPRYGTVA